MEITNLNKFDSVPITSKFELKLQCSYINCVLESFFLSVIYVSSLYVWNSQYSR